LIGAAVITSLLISLLPSIFQYEGYIRRREANAAPMTKAVEVITSVERRRRWSRADKERIVAAAMEPGAVASEVARAAGIHTSQLFR
jgi:transposase-like protein